MLNLPGEHPREISHGERLGGKQNHVTPAFMSQAEMHSRQNISIAVRMIRAAEPPRRMLKRSNFYIVSNPVVIDVHRAG